MDRLDLVIKWRFFKSIQNNNDRDAEAIYCRHILARTNGREPGGSKLTIDDYVKAAHSLYCSMESDGFDGRFPVIIGSNGRLRDGAHRIACALALDVEYVQAKNDRRPGLATEWGRYFLKSCNFTELEVRRVESDLARLLK